MEVAEMNSKCLRPGIADPGGSGGLDRQNQADLLSQQVQTRPHFVLEYDT